SRKMLLPWLCFTLPLTAALAKETLNVLVISDFTLAFVRPLSFDRSLLPSGPFVCPSSAYPDALSQFQFTSDVIANVDRTIPMKIQYYVYSGGDGDPIGNIFSSRDNFTETSIPAYTKFCAEGPENNDFERFLKLTITPSINTDLLILFTAAPQNQIDNALPILSSKVKKVIVLGLNGKDVSKAYPYSSVTITDFTEPERVSCMVIELYETIYGKFSGGVVDAVGLCYPHKEQATMIAMIETTPPRPPMSILFINDFTTNFVGDETKHRVHVSNLESIGKCPGGMYPQAGNELNFTVDVVNGIRADANLNLMFYEYLGGSYPEAISVDSFSRENFGAQASYVLRDACMDDHFPSYLQRFAEEINEVSGDVLVLFTAESLVNRLPIESFRRIIVVGLNGAVEFFPYDDSSISITDFTSSTARGISCMLDRLWDNINDKSLLGCFDTTVAPETTVAQTTAQQITPSPSILFINDFTSDFIWDDERAIRTQRLSVTWCHEISKFSFSLRKRLNAPVVHILKPPQSSISLAK
ncbi:hypothetical protein PENTCL1PPCAC_26000, partial [Pristionchus entomophagus]